MREGEIDVNMWDYVNSVHNATRAKPIFHEKKRLHVCRYCVSLVMGATDFAACNVFPTLQAAVKRCQLGTAKLLKVPDLYETINMSNNFGQ